MLPDCSRGTAAGAINLTYFLSGQRQGLNIYTEDLASACGNTLPATVCAVRAVGQGTTRPAAVHGAAISMHAAFLSASRGALVPWSLSAALGWRIHFHAGGGFINLSGLLRGKPIMHLDHLFHVMDHVRPLDWHSVRASSLLPDPHLCHRLANSQRRSRCAPPPACCAKRWSPCSLLDEQPAARLRPLSCLLGVAVPCLPLSEQPETLLPSGPLHSLAPCEQPAAHVHGVRSGQAVAWRAQRSAPAPPPAHPALSPSAQLIAFVRLAMPDRAPAPAPPASHTCICRCCTRGCR